MEDFFDSSYGFSGGVFHQPVSGCTHRDGGGGGGMALSAYRFHEEDPIAFSGGVKFQWRVGDIINARTHPESPKCFIEKLDTAAGDSLAPSAASFHPRLPESGSPTGNAQV